MSLNDQNFQGNINFPINNEHIMYQMGENKSSNAFLINMRNKYNQGNYLGNNEVSIKKSKINKHRNGINSLCKQNDERKANINHIYNDNNNNQNNNLSIGNNLNKPDTNETIKINEIDSDIIDTRRVLENLNSKDINILDNYIIINKKNDNIDFNSNITEQNMKTEEILFQNQNNKNEIKSNNSFSKHTETINSNLFNINTNSFLNNHNHINNNSINDANKKDSNKISSNFHNINTKEVLGLNNKDNLLLHEINTKEILGLNNENNPLYKYIK